MFLFGNNVMAWQISKILIYGFAIILLCLLFFNLWLNPPLAVAFSLYLASLSGWEDIVPRANAELFAVLGLSLYLFGISLLLRRERSELGSAARQTLIRLVAVISTALGSIVAVGSRRELLFHHSLNIPLLYRLCDTPSKGFHPRALPRASCSMRVCGGILHNQRNFGKWGRRVVRPNV